jgi:RNA polymerase sigma-70 factor (ECF subfamily)
VASGESARDARTAGEPGTTFAFDFLAKFAGLKKIAGETERVNPVAIFTTGSAAGPAAIQLGLSRPELADPVKFFVDWRTVFRELRRNRTTMIHDPTSTASKPTNPPSAAESDEQLLLEYRRTGDRELFAQLVYRYERELYTYLFRYLNDRQMAEDVFQATFLQVHLKCSTFEPGRKVRPWLYTIATHRAIDARRRNKRHRMVSLESPQSSNEDGADHLVHLLESTEADPADSAILGERTAVVRESLNRLPDSMHAVVHLVYYQGMKCREVAAVLDIPVGTVKSRLHAAINRLSNSWETSNPEE